MYVDLLVLPVTSTSLALSAKFAFIFLAGKCLFAIKVTSEKFSVVQIEQANKFQRGGYFSIWKCTGNPYALDISWLINSGGRSHVRDNLVGTKRCKNGLPNHQDEQPRYIGACNSTSFTK